MSWLQVCGHIGRMKRDPDQNDAKNLDNHHRPRLLLTRSGVESVYGVPKRFLELAPARGEGPRFVRIGRSVRYRPEDVEAWLAAQVVDPTAGRR